ncbi:MAG: hypothetical protein ACOC2X_03040 [Bacillota bacterium]
MVLGFIVIGVIVALYLLTYVMNKRTPVPEGCAIDVSEATCGACNNYACSIKHDYAKGAM